ncbi:hypothetical protein [Acidiplasma aeolicum]|jgi:hypothetical protein|uniref:hypothetical protein n=1 Tax=Acidiplasma aeolicum TaxID=507754 RepID=UPI00371361D6
MIETFTYISEPYEKLIVESINYSNLSENYPNFCQSQLYREINSSGLNIPYILSNNNIIFCHNDDGNNILSKISQVFRNMGIDEKYTSRLKVDNRELTFDENNKIIFYRLIRESIMNQYSSGFRDKYGISYEIKDDMLESKIKRYLVINISGQPIYNSMVMIMDLRHKNLGLDDLHFKKISVIDPLIRYRNIKEKVLAIFGSYERFKINIAGNPEIVFNRVKVQIN